MMIKFFVGKSIDSKIIGPVLYWIICTKKSICIINFRNCWSFKHDTLFWAKNIGAVPSVYNFV
ncbi:hypothetical protein AN396_05730 [Candidatus Epulonipiscium fishelsonii]|uniref:Uncharacterized protein n=1 Tax=Candidatus Epulonipiscium fishelsonii TaxID=77094 RepID=A0ACC8XCX9_9FIRM|nr:hypothetical protein AN396_05730 [Epulopiscium sp. SCG-B11WGA-EpuloA1]